MKILCHSYIYITESTTGNIIKMQHMYATSMKTIRIWCKSFISKLTIGRGDKGSRGYLGDKGSKGDRGLPGYPGEHGKKIYIIVMNMVLATKDQWNCQPTMQGTLEDKVQKDKREILEHVSPMICIVYSSVTCFFE